MKKTLVAYFSASGTTANLAQKVADAVNGDLFSIVPTIPYSANDLDWTNSRSRSSIEMNDKSSRPAIKDHVADISQYDTIFVAFPIWWYIAPTIINTFLESYDLTDKTIVTFATSGGSKMGETCRYLQPSCANSKLVEGKVFNKEATIEELSTWISTLKL